MRFIVQCPDGLYVRTPLEGRIYKSRRGSSLHYKSRPMRTRHRAFAHEFRDVFSANHYATWAEGSVLPLDDQAVDAMVEAGKLAEGMLASACGGAV